MSDECKISCENDRSIEKRKRSEMADSSSKEDGDKGFGGIIMILIVLGIVAGLAAAVLFPIMGMSKELKSLTSTLKNQKSFASDVDRPVPELPRDCYDILASGQTKNGIYTIYPDGIKRGLPVYCDMDTDNGGWLVFQRRRDGEQDFFLNWESYQFGFGNQSKEFWLGNEFLHLITSQGWYELRVDMESFEYKEKFAHYKLFHVANRDEKFKLSVAGFSGDVEDSFSAHNGHKFSTDGQDNDNESGDCAHTFKGGWWYSHCLTACLNGQYLGVQHESKANGIHWISWTGIYSSLKWTEMKIRPVHGTAVRS